MVLMGRPNTKHLYQEDGEKYVNLNEKLHNFCDSVNIVLHSFLSCSSTVLEDPRPLIFEVSD
jgi:hypothetical protein